MRRQPGPKTHPSPRRRRAEPASQDFFHAAAPHSGDRARIPAQSICMFILYDLVSLRISLEHSTTGSFMKLAPLLCSLTLAASVATPCAAMAVKGTLSDDNSFNGYMGTLTDIQALSGTDQVPDSAFVFCISPSAHWAGAGATHLYDLGDSFA